MPTLPTHDESHSSRGSTPSQRAKTNMDEKPPAVARRRSSNLKMEEEESQSLHSKVSTPHSQRDTPRKSLRRVTSMDTSHPSTPKQEEDTVGGDITVKVEPGQAPKLSRTSSKKIPMRPAPKFLDLPDAGSEAGRGYETLESCTYANKYLGMTDPALECDCQPEWGMCYSKFMSL